MFLTLSGLLSSIPLLSAVLGLDVHSSADGSGSRDLTFNLVSKTSSVHVRNWNDRNWNDRVHMPVAVNGEEFEVILDTGSTISWMFTQRTPVSIKENNQYYTLKKHDLVPDASFFQLYGGLDWCGGDVFQADVKFGDMTIANQALGSADVITGFCEDISGLFGLAFPYWNTVIGSNNDSILQRITDHLEQPFFATSIKQEGDGESFVDFGFIDPAKHQGNITYVDADSSTGWWGLQFTATTGNTSRPSAGIIDTGTTTLRLAKDIYNEFYSRVPTYGVDNGSGRLVIPCSTELPDLTVDIGQYTVTFSGDDLIGRHGADYCTCYLSMEVVPGMNVLGLPFYESSFIVHKPNFGGQPQLGFARHA